MLADRNRNGRFRVMNLGPILEARWLYSKNEYIIDLRMQAWRYVFAP